MSLAVDFLPGCQSVVIVQAVSGWAREVLALSQAGNLWLQLLSPSPQVDSLIRQQCISLGGEKHVSEGNTLCERIALIGRKSLGGDRCVDANQPCW